MTKSNLCAQEPKNRPTRSLVLVIHERLPNLAGATLRLLSSQGDGPGLKMSMLRLCVCWLRACVCYLYLYVCVVTRKTASEISPFHHSTVSLAPQHTAVGRNQFKTRPIRFTRARICMPMDYYCASRRGWVARAISALAGCLLTGLGSGLGCLAAPAYLPFRVITLMWSADSTTPPPLLWRSRLLGGRIACQRRRRAVQIHPAGSTDYYLHKFGCTELQISCLMRTFCTQICVKTI